MKRQVISVADTAAAGPAGIEFGIYLPQIAGIAGTA
jgi:hypothetical protein